MTNYLALAEQLTAYYAGEEDNAYVAMEAAAALREAHAECIKWRLAEAEAMAVLIGTEERCEKLTAEVKRLHNDGRETTIMLGEAVAEVERLRALLLAVRSLPVGPQGYCSLPLLELFARIDAELGRRNDRSA